MFRDRSFQSHRLRRTAWARRQAAVSKAVLDGYLHDHNYRLMHAGTPHGCHALRLFSPRSRPTRGFGGRLFRAGRFCANRHCQCPLRLLIFAASMASTRSSGRLLRAFYCSRRAGDWTTRATRESPRAPGCGPLRRSVSAVSRFAARLNHGQRQVFWLAKGFLL